MPWSIGSSIRVPLPGPNSKSRRRRRARLPGGRVASSDFCSVRLFNSTLFPPRILEDGCLGSMSSALPRECLAMGGYPRKTMSETELSVICKNCGSEVSPYVTECPYCGARLRKRAPKLERRGDGLEAKPRRRRRPAFLRRSDASATVPFRPYATMVAILGPAVLLLVQKATGYAL